MLFLYIVPVIGVVLSFFIARAIRGRKPWERYVLGAMLLLVIAASAVFSYLLANAQA